MRVAVFIEDGKVICATCDNPEIEVAIVDYSVDKTDAPNATPDGEPCRIALLTGDRLKVDADYVAGIFGEPPVKVPLRIRFGRPETGVPVDELEFNTKGERDAYLQGVGAATDWDDYEVLDDDEVEQE
jgi:hypothetical protein